MYSRVSNPGTGSATPYAVPFPYLDQSHIEVRINDVPTGAFSWINSSAISVNAPVGSTVEIRRNTPKTPAEVTYQDASTLTESDLNLETLQLLYCMQETLDEAGTKLGFLFPGMYNALGNRIVNVGAPINPNDASTKAYVDSTSASDRTYTDAGDAAVTAASKAYADSGDAGVRSFATAGDAVTLDTAKHYAESIMAGSGSGTGTFIQDGVGALTRTFQDKMRDALAATDFAVGDGSTDDTAAFSKLETRFKNVTVNLQGKVYAVAAIPTQNIYRNGGFKVGGKIRWTDEQPASIGRTGAWSRYGGQLRALSDAIADPLYQLVGVTFAGDSITWGSGVTGIEATDPRNGTLGDPRDNAATGSYVNNMKRWFAEALGPSYAVTTANADWPYATAGAGNGQAITTHTRNIELAFLDVGPFTYAVSGNASQISYDSPASVTGSQRRFTVAPGGLGSISFTMTGEQFNFVFDGTTFSDRYNVSVKGSLLPGSPFDMNATRLGQVNPFFNYKRNHSFTFARNAAIKIEFIPPADGTSTSSVYAGAIEVPKQIRVKNQGINGATSHTYWMFNFPTAKVTYPALKKVESEYGASIAGTGTVAKTTVNAPSSATGQQVQLDMYVGGVYTVTCPIPAGSDSLLIGYSQINNGAAIQVFADGTQIDTFTSAGAVAYGMSRLVRFPAGTANVTIKNVADSVNHIGFYMEGLVAFNYASASTYPTNNSFGKGVALDFKDSFCFFQLGTNDRIAGTGPNYPSQSSTANKLPRMIDLMPDGCQAVIMCANPAMNDGPPTYWGSMADIRNQLKNIAKSRSIDFIDNYELLRGIPPMVFTSDGLHPNEYGARLMSSNIIGAIRSA